ncbi:hypothetical protein BCR44DRAFT_1431809 [Catenaria anguillulae PL171]|uniref:Uncharacterized protein n=1 Tax=Catenaria anguillulae PL171 TaxID=765915 RepID=A0A1Y2HSP0_9FUNG|nr:hypothetical protein BCR44DRAFT_1431809 [Catenaria anguillulae PL171]
MGENLCGRLRTRVSGFRRTRTWRLGNFLRIEQRIRPDRARMWRSRVVDPQQHDIHISQ